MVIVEETNREEEAIKILTELREKRVQLTRVKGMFEHVVDKGTENTIELIIGQEDEEPEGCYFNGHFIFGATIAPLNEQNNTLTIADNEELLLEVLLTIIKKLREDMLELKKEYSNLYEELKD